MAPPVGLPQTSRLATKRPVRIEVAEVTREVRAVPVERLRVALLRAFQGDDTTIRQELRERAVQHLVRLLGRVVPYEVDRHVVRGSKRRAEIVSPRRRQSRDPLERHLTLVQHDRMAERVDPTTARPPGELRVLPRRDELVALALELPQILDHDGLRRHIDPERQGLGGEDDLDQPGREQLLDRLLEDRKHPRVVRRDAGGRRLHEQVEPQGLEISIVDPRGPSLGDIADPASLLARRQLEARVEEPPNALVAPRAAEDEVDRGKHARSRKHLYDVFAPRDPRAALDAGHRHRSRGVGRSSDTQTSCWSSETTYGFGVRTPCCSTCIGWRRRPTR